MNWQALGIFHLLWFHFSFRRWTLKLSVTEGIWNRPKGYFPTTVPMDKNVASAKSASVTLSPTRKILSPFMDGFRIFRLQWLRTFAKIHIKYCDFSSDLRIEVWLGLHRNLLPSSVLLLIQHRQRTCMLQNIATQLMQGFETNKWFNLIATLYGKPLLRIRQQELHQFLLEPRHHLNRNF